MMRRIAIIIVLACACSTVWAATITAAGSGNWSAGATWVGGVAPGNGDTAETGGYTIALDITTVPASGTLLALKNTAGGGYTLAMAASDVTINCTDLVAVGANNLLTVSGASAKTLTVNGNLTAGTTGVCIYSTSTCSLAGTGAINGGTGTAGYAVYNLTNTMASLNWNGSVTAGTGSTAYGIYLSRSVSPWTVTGTVTGGGGAGTSSYGIFVSASSASGTLNGNAVGGTANNSNGVVSYSPWTLNGNIVNGTGGTGVAAKSPTWNNAANSATITWANTGRGNVWGTMPAVNELAYGVVCGTNTGTFPNPPTVAAIGAEVWNGIYTRAIDSVAGGTVGTVTNPVSCTYVPNVGTVGTVTNPVSLTSTTTADVTSIKTATDALATWMRHMGYR